jgi:hypothetical protein
VNQRPITDAVATVLADAGITVGDGSAADNGGWNDDFTRHTPYVVVQPIAGGTRSGTLQEWEEKAELVYQLTCVAVHQRACEQLVDTAGAALRGLIGNSYDGVKVMLVRNDFGSHQVRRADDVEPAEPVLFYGTPRFRLWVTTRNAT